MLQGKKVILRAMESSDLNLIYRWENDVENWKHGDTLIPFSKEEIERYIKGVRDIYADKQLRLIICNSENNQAIGLVDLFDFDPRHSRAAIGILIGNKLLRNQGFASDTLITICDYAFNILAINQLHCSIADDNQTSIKLFASVGFQECGRRKMWHFRNELWHDELLFQRIKDQK